MICKDFTKNKKPKKPKFGTFEVFRFLPRDASAERSDATVRRPSVRPPVCL